MHLEHPTLTQFVLEQEADLGASGDFSNILLDVGVVGKVISRELNKAGLVNIFGVVEDGNASGDEVQKLDVLSNDLFKDYLRGTGHFCAFASEEENDIVVLEDSLDSEYVIAFDPLDGSSNIDFNVSVGTIFSIHKRVTPEGSTPTMEDFLQAENTQVAAGYIIYGSSTMLVYTTGHGVHGFTLDQSIGEWLLSHRNITIPEDCSIYSANEGYSADWDQLSRNFLQQFKAEREKASSRHIGSLVADVHRNILKGGIHFRPYDNAEKRKAKLRLNYELKPLAMIIEQAGGYATTGTQSIMDIVPTKLHQKEPVVQGNADIVRAYETAYTAAAQYD